MSDFFSSLLGGNDASLDSKKLSKMNQVDNPVLFKKGDSPKVTFLVDEFLTPRQVLQFKTVIENHSVTSYQILYTVKVKFTDKDLSSGIWRKFRDFSWDFTQYIPKWSTIISFGRALYSLTHSNDLDCSLLKDEDSASAEKNKDKFSIVNGFYDHLLWKTSFYDPKTSCMIYPVDEWRHLINKKTGFFKNTWEYYFLTKQIELANSYHGKPKKIKKIKTIEIENPNQFLLDHKDDKQITGLDIETSSFDPWSKTSFIICITIAFYSDPYTGYYLDNKNIDSKTLIEFLKDRPLIGSNFKFDGKFLHLKHGVPLSHLKIAGDTVQLSHICNETMRKGLKAGAYLWTEYGGYDEALDIWRENNPKKKSYADIPKEVLMPYATTDPCISLLVHQELLNYLKKLDSLVNHDNPYGYSLQWSYESIIIPSLNLFMEIELEGLNIDKNILKEKERLLQEEIKIIEKDIHDELGENINLSEEENENSNLVSFDDLLGSNETSKADITTKISSAKQLGHKLEELGFPIFDRANTKARTPKTGEEQLRDWSKKGYKLADKILYYREKTKLLSTYVGIEKNKSGMYYWLHDDDKIHSQYNCFSALSWRHTSAYPNAQNWPSHGEKAELIRSFIVPPSKLLGFLSTDFAGLQLRLACMLSKDPVMIQAFKYEGGDLHSRTAYDVMLKYMTEIKSLEEMHKIRKGKTEEAEYVNDIRFKAKSINFGFLFGSKASTAYVQSIKTNWTPKDADKYIKANNLQNEVEKHLRRIEDNEYRFIQPFTREENLLNAKYYTIAIDVRAKFFTTYAGLDRWIEETRAYAKEHGYVKSVYGAIRRLPYLLISPTDSNREEINMGYYSNLLNICLNSPIQNMESIVMNRAFLKIWEWLKSNPGNGKMFGQIHDAMEQYANVDNWKELALKVHELAEKDYPEYDGIPLEVESNFSNFYGEGELWDMGKKYKTEDLKK